MNKSKKNTNLYLFVALIVLAGSIFFLLPTSPKKQKITDYSKDPRCIRQNQNYLNTMLSAEQRAEDLLLRMSDAEKIGQMALVEKNSVHDLSDIGTYNLGAMLSGFGAKPEPNTPVGWLDMISKFQAETKKTCLQIPLLYGVDAIHGFSNVPGSTVFPHFIGLGATQDAELVKKVAAATTQEMSAVGIYWNFSPNMDVPLDPRWGRTYETFGSNPVNVSNLGAAFIEGTQSSKLPYLASLSTVKHYVGNGATNWNSSANKDYKIDQGNIPSPSQALLNQQLTPFKKAVQSGAHAVIVGLNSIDGIKMSANKHLITDVLRNEMGFSGIVVSDWYGVFEISNSSYDSTVTAVNAGIDMVMLPYDYKKFEEDMTEALKKKDITTERLNEAVKNILIVKFQLGLFDRPTPTLEGLSIIGNQKNKDLARQAVRKSQVLLKNQNNTLPLSKSLKKIIVAGSGADNLGRQMGGWSIEWQGIDGNWIPGTTILSGIKNTVSKNTNVEYNLTGDFPETATIADVGIAVVSEKPYAEGWGDVEEPSLSNEDLAAIEKLKTQSKKIVVIIISGRPLNISDHISNWDAAIASWLPGSEGQGVSDVLFGTYPFSGKLPIKWTY